MELEKASPEEVELDPNGIQALHAFADRMYETNVTSAQVYAVARGGKLVAHRSVGILDPQQPSAQLSTSALFPLCSITKVYTAAAIMILVEKGLVGLNRPVCDYFL